MFKYQQTLTMGEEVMDNQAICHQCKKPLDPNSDILMKNEKGTYFFLISCQFCSLLHRQIKNGKYCPEKDSKGKFLFRENNRKDSTKVA